MTIHIPDDDPRIETLREEIHRVFVNRGKDKGTPNSYRELPEDVQACNLALAKYVLHKMEEVPHVA